MRFIVHDFCDLAKFANFFSFHEMFSPKRYWTDCQLCNFIGACAHMSLNACTAFIVCVPHCTA